jgi:hypothetical protein
MTMLASHSTTTTTGAKTRSLHTLDSLARMTSSELETIYRAGQCSTDMHAADGALVGRMLAVRGVPGAAASVLRRWAAGPSFLWEGKTFSATSQTRGTGINRVALGRALGRQNLFPFETAFGPSAIDGKPTLVLDYELGVNPPYIQRIHDEIRGIAPGLFLGPAMWKSGASKTLVLWFALDSRLS